MYYIGLDVHKRKISYCVKERTGKIYAEGSIPATRMDLDQWMKALPQPAAQQTSANHIDRSGEDTPTLQPLALGVLAH